MGRGVFRSLWLEPHFLAEERRSTACSVASRVRFLFPYLRCAFLRGRCVGGAVLAVGRRAGRSRRRASPSIASSRPRRAAASCRSSRWTSTATCGRPPGWSAAWAWKPLVVYDGQSSQVAALVAQQLVEHVQGAVVLWNRARFDLDLPGAAGPQRHVARVVGGQTYGAPDGQRRRRSAAGGRRPACYAGGTARSPPLLGAQLFLPTGDTKAFSSDGGVRFWPRLLGGGAARSADLGGALRRSRSAAERVRLRPVARKRADGGRGRRLAFRAALRRGPELYLASAIAGGPFASRAGTSLEMMLAGHLGGRAALERERGRRARLERRRGHAGGAQRGRRPVCRRAAAPPLRRRRPGHLSSQSRWCGDALDARRERWLSSRGSWGRRPRRGGRADAAVTLRHQANQVGRLRHHRQHAGPRLPLAGRRRPWSEPWAPAARTPAIADPDVYWRSRDSATRRGQQRDRGRQRALDGDAGAARGRDRSPTRGSTGAPPASSAAADTTVTLDRVGTGAFSSAITADASSTPRRPGWTRTNYYQSTADVTSHGAGERRRRLPVAASTSPRWSSIRSDAPYAVWWMVVFYRGATSRPATWRSSTASTLLDSGTSSVGGDGDRFPGPDGQLTTPRSASSPTSVTRTGQASSLSGTATPCPTRSTRRTSSSTARGRTWAPPYPMPAICRS